MMRQAIASTQDALKAHCDTIGDCLNLWCGGVLEPALLRFVSQSCFSVHKRFKASQLISVALRTCVAFWALFMPRGAWLNEAPGVLTAMNCPKVPDKQQNKHSCTVKAHCNAICELCTSLSLPHNKSPWGLPGV